MTQVTFEELLDAGCHFGHLKRKWNPNMAPYIFMERNGIQQFFKCYLCHVLFSF